MATRVGPYVDFRKSRTAAPSWIREESQAHLNSVKMLITEIDSFPLNSWSYIWTTNFFCNFCITTVRSSTCLWDLWIDGMRNIQRPPGTFYLLVPEFWRRTRNGLDCAQGWCGALVMQASIAPLSLFGAAILIATVSDSSEEFMVLHAFWFVFYHRMYPSEVLATVVSPSSLTGSFYTLLSYWPVTALFKPFWYQSISAFLMERFSTSFSSN